jgi:hypothetical protein
MPIQFIKGSLLIFSIKNKVIFNNTVSSLYCHHTCFSFVYWTIAITWTLTTILSFFFDPSELFIDSRDVIINQTEKHEKLTIYKSRQLSFMIPL